MAMTYRTILETALRDLDAHREETRRLLDARPAAPAVDWAARSDTSVYLVEACINAARMMLREMDALDRLNSKRTQEDT